jgi:hypothetical protein
MAKQITTADLSHILSVLYKRERADDLYYKVTDCIMLVAGRERDPITQHIRDTYAHIAADLDLLRREAKQDYVIIKHTSAGSGPWGHWTNNSRALDDRVITLYCDAYSYGNETARDKQQRYDRLIRSFAITLQIAVNRRGERLRQRLQQRLQQKRQREQARLQKEMDKRLDKLLASTTAQIQSLESKSLVRYPKLDIESVVANLKDPVYRFSKGLTQKASEDETEE